MKIGIFSIPDFKLGRHSVKDERLDQVDKLVRAKKKTYVQVEVVGEESLRDADAIIAMEGSRVDLILTDMEFVEARLGRCEQESERALLTKIKSALEKEKFVSDAGLTPQEYQMISGYSLLTAKPVIGVKKDELEDLDKLFWRALRESGYMSFFTAGEKETRAWMIKKGMTAWEASGAIHSDIQKGFIRAEIISLDEYLASGGETAAKQAGKMRLEQKDYVMQDADLVNIRFNK